MYDIFLFIYYLFNDNGIFVKKKKKKVVQLCRYLCIINFKFVCSVVFLFVDYDLIIEIGLF